MTFGSLAPQARRWKPLEHAKQLQIIGYRSAAEAVWQFILHNLLEPVTRSLQFRNLNNPCVDKIASTVQPLIPGRS